MEQKRLFRIVFNYTDEEEATGKAIKGKKEVITSAVNYTDAESLGMHIIPDLQTYSDEVDHEIKRLQKPHHFVLTPVMTVANELVNGLFNYYIEHEDVVAGLYNITAEFTEVQDSGKEKVVTEQWVVPAENSRDAYDILQRVLKHIDIRDFSLKNIKFDKADELFFTKEEHQSHITQSENVGIL